MTCSQSPASTQSTLRYLSLFAGIGGIDLGLDRAGMTCVGQVEIDPYCRQVLARHWPEVPQHDDVRTAVEWWRSIGGGRPDVIAGGFPCQPFAISGRKHGTGDERWAWPWFAAVVRALRPRYVLVENVAHARERLLAVAYPAGELWPAWLAQEQRKLGQAALRQGADGEHAWSRPGVWLEAARGADRVADGPTHRMVAAGGNAVVPQVAEFAGRLIVSHAALEAVAA